MNILLIGASGFVGTHLIDQLKSKYSLVNFDKQQSKKYFELTTIIDIRNKEALLLLLKGFDLVILLAAEHRDDVNVQGTKNVLEVMDENIIFTSFVAVYGVNKNNSLLKSLHYNTFKGEIKNLIDLGYN